MILTLYVRGEVYARYNYTVLFQFQAMTTPGVTFTAVRSGNALRRLEQSKELVAATWWLERIAEIRFILLFSPNNFFAMLSLWFSVSSMYLYA